MQLHTFNGKVRKVCLQGDSAEKNSKRFGVRDNLPRIVCCGESVSCERDKKKQNLTKCFGRQNESFEQMNLPPIHYDVVLRLSFFFWYILHFLKCHDR